VFPFVIVVLISVSVIRIERIMLRILRAGIDLAKQRFVIARRISFAGMWRRRLILGLTLMMRTRVALQRMHRIWIILRVVLRVIL